MEKVLESANWDLALMVTAVWIFLDQAVFINKLLNLLSRSCFSLKLFLHITSGFVLQVTIACDAVLSSKSPYRKQDPDTWENELPVSKYANNLTQLDNGVRIPPRWVSDSEMELHPLKLAKGIFMFLPLLWTGSYVYFYQMPLIKTKLKILSKKICTFVDAEHGQSVLLSSIPTPRLSAASTRLKVLFAWGLSLPAEAR